MPVSPIRVPSPADQAALLALNNAHTTELSGDAPEFGRLLSIAMAARMIGDEAFLLTFDQTPITAAPTSCGSAGQRASPISIVSWCRRRRGAAGTPGGSTTSPSRATPATSGSAQVNSDPPNPVSDAFHARPGFGLRRSPPPDRGKSVRYLIRAL